MATSTPRAAAIDDVLATFAARRDVPAAPGPDDVRWLLNELAALCDAGGPRRLLRAPVRPDREAFPAPWQPTIAGVASLVETLCAHADAAGLGIAVDDLRALAVSTDRHRVTEVEVAVGGDARRPRFGVLSIGEDDVAGTLAHDVGVVLAAAMPRIDGTPYRGAGVEPDAATETDAGAETGSDAGAETGSETGSEAGAETGSETGSETETGSAADARARRAARRAQGSVAAVWAGLGVLAANASYQQRSGGAFRAERGFAPLEYTVVRAGHLPLPALAFLLAVQARVRGADAVPTGLGGPQADETAAWLRVLPEATTLHALLGIESADVDAPADARTASPWPHRSPAPADELVGRDEPGGATMSLDDPTLGVTARGSRRGQSVYRVAYRRTGTGFVVGLVAGGGAFAATGQPLALLGGLAVGFAVGTMTKVDRCATCIEVLPAAATDCPRCGGHIAGRIASRDRRLDHDVDADASDASPPPDAAA